MKILTDALIWCLILYVIYTIPYVMLCFILGFGLGYHHVAVMAWLKETVAKAEKALNSDR